MSARGDDGRGARRLSSANREGAAGWLIRVSPAAGTDDWRATITMNKGLILIAAALLVVSAAYGLNRGIFVGSERALYGPAPCSHMLSEWKGEHVVWREVLPGEKAQCPDDGYIQKQCRYLFITGISKIKAYDDTVNVSHAADLNEVRSVYSQPENGYCRLFAPS